MPNYGLVVTPQYNPMSYEQYAKPFEDYAKVYNQMADTYDALEMEANQWEKLAQNAKDAPQYQQYKRYADDLRNAASDLADNGLSVKTRGTLSRLRKRYANEIKPIADAYALREEEMKLQRQARLTHPDIMFSREAADTGLGAYMAGVPEFQTYTEGMLTKNVSDAAKNLATEASEDLRRNGPKSKWYTILGGKYYEKATRTGLTAEDVLSSMFNPQTGEINPNANPYLEQILNDALGQSGISNWENWDSLKERAYGALNRGLWDAIGKVDYKNLQNPEWELNEKERRAGLQAAKELDMKFQAINNRRLYTANEKDILTKYASYFDDKGKLTDEGKKKLTKTLTFSPGTAGGGTFSVPSLTSFGKVVFNIAKKNNPMIADETSAAQLMNTSPQLFYDAVENAYANLSDSDTSDLRSVSEVYYQYTNSKSGQAESIKNAINSELSRNHTHLYEAEFDGEHWKNGSAGPSSLGEDDKIIATSYSRYGTTVEVANKKGEVKTYILPSLYKDAEDARDASLNSAYEAAAKYYEALENNDIIRAREYYNRYKEHTINANWYHSQIGFSNDLESQKYNTRLIE